MQPDCDHAVWAAGIELRLAADAQHLYKQQEEENTCGSCPLVESDNCKHLGSAVSSSCVEQSKQLATLAEKGSDGLTLKLELCPVWPT